MHLALHHHLSRNQARSAHGLAGALTSLAAAVMAWPTRVVEHRRLMNQMAGMSDHELRDIGLFRQDVADATAVPYGHDPSEVLVERAAERRRWSRD
ncbi:MAG TPA: DUF1127 domain-containing protein [Lichenihabitans sp.]|jgi:uncharacterized protein YjiS (DUF1127 family)|nr:DUF1127 domain-containing protein [Lichenihabitans sp.]